MERGGSGSLRRSVQALLECGMISREEVAFLCEVIAEEAAADACREGLRRPPGSPSCAGALQREPEQAVKYLCEQLTAK